jgi:hypothetical protein
VARRQKIIHDMAFDKNYPSYRPMEKCPSYLSKVKNIS